METKNNPDSETFQISFVGTDQKLTLPKNNRQSLLDIAMENNIEIDHACGGVCACSTCHVIVREGISACSASTEEEEDQLDEAVGVTPSSRLACQCIPTGKTDLVIEIPSWNRNLVREGT